MPTTTEGGNAIMLCARSIWRRSRGVPLSSGKRAARNVGVDISRRTTPRLLVSSVAGTLDVDIVRFLSASGLVTNPEGAKATALTGGVSSDIWRIDAAGRTFVLKR